MKDHFSENCFDGPKKLKMDSVPTIQSQSQLHRVMYCEKNTEISLSEKSSSINLEKKSELPLENCDKFPLDSETNFGSTLDSSFEFSEFPNIDVSYSAQDIQLLKDRIKKLVNENRNLKNDLKKLRKENETFKNMANGSSMKKIYSMMIRF